MGRRRKPWMRDVNGILALDKPRGLSSNHALQQVRRAFSAAKGGHTGSLDPLATGMLPLCFGPCTKLSHFLLDADKVYAVRARIGVKTSTADAEGEIIAESAERPTLAAFRAAAEAFTGKISQVPPMYSAVHHEGRRLYELARKGEEVVREPREVMIYALEIEALEGDELVLRMRCSKGTYVRTLIEDLAVHCNALAHVSALHRESVGPFPASAMVTLDAALAAAEEGPAAVDALLLPPSAALQDWPAVTLDSARAFYLARGEAVRVAAAPTSGRVAVFGPGGSLLALAEINEDGMVAPRRMMQVPA